MLLENLCFFLGGRDLEMVTIRALLDQHAPARCHDKNLPWGAKSSAYRQEIEAALQQGQMPALIELEDDLGLANKAMIVDHHGALAGSDRKTSLEQIFNLLGRPQSEWTRHLALVAANDRGHVKAMLEVPGATLEEIRQIRFEDRRAQGITAAEEELGQAAARNAETVADGRLTVVYLPHGRTATVTDVLDRDLGGRGYENLVIFSPDQTTFYGSGVLIERLKTRFPGGYYGGDLPCRGFWGHPSPLNQRTMVEQLTFSEPTRNVR